MKLELWVKYLRLMAEKIEAEEDQQRKVDTYIVTVENKAYTITAKVIKNG